MATTTVPETRTFMISEEERLEMVRLLEEVLGETRVEIHRTPHPRLPRGSRDRPRVAAPRFASQAPAGR